MALFPLFVLETHERYRIPHPGFLTVPISAMSCVSAEAVSSELSPGVDCCVFHRKVDK